MPQDDALDITLHIGGAKCGSSAIQAYLARNAGTLADRGIAVPGTAVDFESDVTGEQIWAFESAAVHDLRAAALKEKLARLLDATAAKGFGRLILSAENICNHPALATLVAEVVGPHRLKVVFYVRRQDDFLISAWQQWHLKLYGSVDAFLADRVGKLGCWLNMIEPWAAAFGDKAIRVRPFVRDHLAEGDVVADFCRTAGIDPEGLVPLDRAANPSFDEALGRLAHRVRDVFDNQHDNRFYEVMVRLLGDAALKSASGSSLLSLETRRRIMDRYAAENDALQARFLPELGSVPLFQRPAPRDIRQESREDQLSQEIALLTRAVYQLAARTERDARLARNGRDG